MTTGDQHHHGDVVHMNQTTDSVGIDKRQTFVAGAPAASAAELERAIRQLLPLLRELREQLPPLSARTVEAAEAEIGGSADPEVRRTALERAGGIAEAVGTVGVPALALIQQILALLGG
ncbi:MULTISPECIES: hypothetical protein [unclassified Streptomyces]|uniref:hypothetical protein n=1 Tax=unclassified Streptomyces TaxID=2593676 RepID=UPI00344B610E